MALDNNMASEESPLFTEEETPAAPSMGGNVGDDGLVLSEQQGEGETKPPLPATSDKEGERSASSTNDGGYKGKYNWDDPDPTDDYDKKKKKKKNEKASVTPSSGAILDYAWCDGKKSVSVYVDLPGLDSVRDDDMHVSLTNDGGGVLFEAKNATATTTGMMKNNRRFLEIDKLYKKVKSAKLVRKRGKDRVIIKLAKDDEKRKWYNLKGGGDSSSSSGYYDDDDDYEDPWIPPEDDEEAVDDLPSGSRTEDDDEREGEVCEEAGGGVDAPPTKEVDQKTKAVV